MDELDLGSTIKGFAAGQKVFNRYSLKKFLGRGGMGVVWLVRDEELGRDSAIKFLPEIVATDRASIDEMKREVRRAIDLAHPHIIKTHDFITDGRTAGVSMEYVPGGTLSALRMDEPDQVFTVERLSPWVKQLCEALDYAHETGEVVHRDLKPTNLMLDAKGRLKIVDFGIAASISDSVSRVSQQAGSSGTPVYMSPQQMMGEDPAVTDDVYAAGATLYELLTGKPPFHSGNILLQVQNKVAPPLNERRRTLNLAPVPDEWEQTIAACLAKDAAARPQSAREIAEQLGLLGTGSGHRPTSGAQRPLTASPVGTAPVPAVVPPPAATNPSAAAKAPESGSLLLASAKSGLLLASILVGPIVAVTAYTAWGTSEFGEDMGLGFLWWAGSATVFGAIALIGRLVKRAFSGTVAAAGLPKISGFRRWVLAPLAGSALPVFATFLAVAGVKGNSKALDGEVLAFLLIVLVFSAAVSMIPVRVLQVARSSRSQAFVIFCALLGALVGYWLGSSMDIPAAWVLLATISTGLVWAISGHWLHRLAQGRLPGSGRDLAIHPITIGLVIILVVRIFGYALPDAANETTQARDQRAEREAHELVERERQAREKREREAAAAKEVEAARLRDARRAEAAPMIVEAFHMVFDRSPNAAERALYEQKMLAEPELDAAALRRELRASEAGRKGGRLLVPEEFATIGAAVSAAVPGNTVRVGPGYYAESVHVNGNLTLIGAGAAETIVEVPAADIALVVAGDAQVTVRGFTFRHSGTLDANSRMSVVGLNDAKVVFEDNVVAAANGNAIHVKGAGLKTIRHNRLGGGRWTGVAVYTGAQAEVVGNQITGFEQSGIGVYEQPKQVLLSGNVVTGCGQNGIWIGQGDNVVLENNEASGNSTAAPNYGGIGIGDGRPTLRGNRAQLNSGTGIWWVTEKARPVVGAGNFSDGKELTVTN